MTEPFQAKAPSLAFDDLDLSGIDDFSIDIVETSAHAAMSAGAASCAGCGVGCSCSCSCRSCAGCSCSDSDQVSGDG